MTSWCFSIRTPLEIVLRVEARSARVSTPSGWVGLRPRGESQVLVVSAGLLLIQTDRKVRYAASAGGVLEASARESCLYTPFASTGDSAQSLLATLDSLLATPTPELSARRQLGELEQRIVHELRGARAPLRGEGPHE